MTGRRLLATLWLVLMAAPRGGLAQTSTVGESLDDAWRIAIADDRRLAAARELTGSAEHGVVAAKASRLPAVNLDGGYTALNHAPATAVSIPPLFLPGSDVPLQLPFNRLVVAPARAWSYQVAASLPLYTSGRISESIAAADATLQMARAEQVSTVLDVKMRVVEAFVAVLRARRQIEVVDSEVAGLASHASDAANLFEQGVTARNDRLAADVALADARQRRIQAANALDGAAAAYNRLLHRALDRPVTLIEPSLLPPEGDLATFTARAIAARPELAVLANQAEAHAHRAASRMAVAHPQAAVTGGYAYDQNPYQLFPGLWSVGVGVRWLLFDGGASRAEAAAEQGQADAATSQQEELRSLVALEVRQAWLDLDSAERRRVVAHDAIAQAEENVRVSRDRYTAGVGIATEVLDAETLRARAHMNWAAASYDWILALMRLRRAMGEL